MILLGDLLRIPTLRELHPIRIDGGVRIGRVVGIPGDVRSAGRRLTQEAGTCVVLLDPIVEYGVLFDVFVRRCERMGVVAVVFATGREPDRGTLALSARLRVSLLESTDPWGISVALHEQLAVSDARAVQLAARVARVASTREMELSELMAASSRALGSPVCLLDDSGELISGTPGLSEGDRERFVALVAHGGEEVSMPAGEDSVLVAQAVWSGPAPRVWAGALVPARMRGEQRAMAGALRVLAVAAGHRIALIRLEDERDARRRTSLFEQLRAADGRVSNDLARRALASGWSLDAWHIGIRLVARAQVDSTAVRTEILRGFARQGVSLEVVEQLDGWVAWTSTAVQPTGAMVRRLVGRIRAAQRALLPGIPTNVGVGSVQSGADGLVRSLAEATDAAKLAADRPASGHFVHIDRLGLAQLLLAWTQTDTFIPAARRLLEPLLNGQDHLLETLLVYLDSESSTSGAAATLGVHRNTVNERIAKIRRLLNVDLSDPETRLALHLAARTVTLPEQSHREARQGGEETHS
jgi:hypothetical protein